MCNTEPQHLGGMQPSALFPHSWVCTLAEAALLLRFVILFLGPVPNPDVLRSWQGQGYKRTSWKMKGFYRLKFGTGTFSLLLICHWPRQVTRPSQKWGVGKCTPSWAKVWMQGEGNIGTDTSKVQVPIERVLKLVLFKSVIFTFLSSRALFLNMMKVLNIVLQANTIYT